MKREILLTLVVIGCLLAGACSRQVGRPQAGSTVGKSETEETADADIEVMRELVSEDKTFTHMSGLQQTREEYFADVADGSLTYYTIGIADPVIKVDGEKAQITYTSVLNADAYGARGTFRMKGTHHYEKRGGAWIVANP